MAPPVIAPPPDPNSPWATDPSSAAPEGTPWEQDEIVQGQVATERAPDDFTPPDWREKLQIAGRSFVRGVQLGQPIGRGGGPTPENLRRVWQGDSAALKSGNLTPEETKAEQARRARINKEYQADRERVMGNRWLTSLPETAGEFVGDPRMYLGGKGTTRPVTAAASLAAREVGGAFGQNYARSTVGEKIRDFARTPTTTLAEARAADKAAGSPTSGRGTLGMQDPPFKGAVQGVERFVAALPGGKPVVKAAEAMQTSKSRVVDFIVHNLTNGRTNAGADLEAFYQRWGGGLTPQERNLVRSIIPDTSRSTTAEGVRAAREAGLDRLFGLVRNSRSEPLMAMHVLEPLTRYMSPGTRVALADRRLLAGLMLDRMGTTAVDGARGSFTIENFLRNWDSMDEAVADHLFGQLALDGEERGITYASQVNRIVSSMKSMEAYASMAGRAGRGATSNLYRPTETWVARGEAFAMIAGLIHLIGYGNPRTLAGAVGTLAGTNLAARALTNPQTVAWLAQQMTRYATLAAVHHNPAAQEDFLDELNRVPQ